MKSSGSFKPGQSGNPGGSTRGLERLMRDELKAVRQATLGADGKPGPEVDGYTALFRRMWEIAMTGADKDSIAATKLIFERTHGMPKQKIEIAEDVDSGADVDWSAVAVEKRRELLETLLLIAPSDAAAEH